MTIDWLITKDFNEQCRLSLHAAGSCYFRHSETVMNLYSAFSSYIHTMNMNMNMNIVSYDHRNYERNLSKCEQKPEKVRTSTGFEPVTSRYRCDALTN